MENTEKLCNFARRVFSRVIRETSDGGVKLSNMKGNIIKINLSKQELIDINPSYWLPEEAIAIIVEVFVTCSKIHNHTLNYSLQDLHRLSLILVLKTIHRIINTGKFTSYTGLTISITPEIRNAFALALIESEGAKK